MANISGAIQQITDLEKARTAAGLTRSELALRCEAVALSDPKQLATISTAAIRRLEIGETSPRLRTASTLAKALNTSVENLFPMGVDAVVRNPSGVTRIDPDRPKRAMAREIQLAEKLGAMLAELEIPYAVERNYSVSVHAKGAQAFYDFAFPDARLAIEISSLENRLQLPAHEGWTSILISTDELARQPQAVIIKILSALLRLTHN